MALFKCDYNNNFELNLNFKIMKKLLLVFVFYGISCSMFSQVEKEENSKYFDYFDRFENPVFRIGTGLLIPEGGIKNYFGVSPFVEVGVIFPVIDQKSFEFLAQFAIPTQEEDFLYEEVEGITEGRSTFMMNILLKIKKHIIHTEESDFNFGFGLGVSHVLTDIRNPFFEGKEGEEKYESITSILMSPGIEYVRRVNSYDVLSFGFALQISPYKIEGAVRENIGSLFFVPKITYSF